MLQTLADIRAEMASHRPRLQTQDLARELGMSYGRCSTLLNSDPDLELTKAGVERWNAAIERLKSQVVAA